MGNCPVCGKTTNLTCICGYCSDCLKRFGHEGCAELVKDRMKEDSPLIKDMKKNGWEVEKIE